MAQTQPISREAWTLLIALSLVWGGAFFFGGVVVRELPTFTIVFCRVGLAALALWLWLSLTSGPRPQGAEMWRTCIVMGLLNNAIPFSLIVWGQHHIASGLASILNATTPLFTVLVAHAFTSDERLTGGKIAGAALGLCGVAVLIGGDALAGLGSNVLAQCAVLGATLSYACAGVWGRRFRALGVRPAAAAVGQLTASSLILAPLALIVDRPWTLEAPGGSTVAALVAFALVSTACAYLMFFRILELAGATAVMLVTLLVPISAILLGWAFLEEALAARHFLGMAIIALSLAAIDGRIFARLRKAKGVG
jgi:drug/metabolite transporter (DMT)-like permease